MAACIWLAPWRTLTGTSPERHPISREACVFEEKSEHILTAEQEVSRIMGAFRLDAYAVLDIYPGAPASDIKATFRRKSLLIHPDKCKDPRAPDAFDRLERAEADLMDDGKREELDSHFTESRKLVMAKHKLTRDSEDVKEDWFYKEVRQMVKHVMVEDELRKRRQRQVKLAQEGREKAEHEKVVTDMKRKREDQRQWDDTRENRVSSWRDFQKKGTKKSKVLGR